MGLASAGAWAQAAGGHVGEAARAAPTFRAKPRALRNTARFHPRSVAAYVPNPRRQRRRLRAYRPLLYPHRLMASDRATLNVSAHRVRLAHHPPPAPRRPGARRRLRRRPEARPSRSPNARSAPSCCTAGRCSTSRSRAGTIPVVVKEQQRHPVRGRLLHLDLLEVKLDEAIQAEVAIELEGTEDAPGVKEGGVLEHVTREITVEALPTEIPERIVVDVSGDGDQRHPPAQRRRRLPRASKFVGEGAIPRRSRSPPSRRRASRRSPSPRSRRRPSWSARRARARGRGGSRGRGPGGGRAPAEGEDSEGE